MKVEYFVSLLKENGFGPITGVPCSVFKDLINYIQSKETLEYYICSSEGEAMGIAGGFALSGKFPIVYMQNDGFGNAINPLSSLQLLYKLPVLMLISWRGEPGKVDAPQHKVMGEKLCELLSTFNIPYNILKNIDDDISCILKKVKNHFEINHTPFAFIITKGYFEDYPLKNLPNENSYYPKRIEYLNILKSILKKDDIIMGATGFSGRELYQIFDHKAKFYMMGSMGCLASIGLGIAETFPNKNVYVLDGDGALLMKMGSLATIGYYKPSNFIHILFDNGQYESTGGQKAVSSVVDFSIIASKCGYRSVENVSTLDKFKTVLLNIDRYLKPVFIWVKISPGTIKLLSRPSDTPEKMRDNFMKAVKAVK